MSSDKDTDQQQKQHLENDGSPVATTTELFEVDGVWCDDVNGKHIILFIIDKKKPFSPVYMLHCQHAGGPPRSRCLDLSPQCLCLKRPFSSHFPECPVNYLSCRLMTDNKLVQIVGALAVTGEPM